MRKRWGWFAILALVLLLVTACGGSKSADQTGASGAAGGAGKSAQPVEIKVDMIVSSDSSWFPAAQRFKDLVEQRTDGKVTVSLHPGGELLKGNQANEMPMLVNGDFDMSIVSDTIVSQVEPKIGAVSLPFLFHNYTDVDKFRSNPVSQELLDSLTSHGLIGLAWGEGGFRQLTNNKHPVTKPDDLSDLAIRVPNVKLLISTWKALGKDPIVMSFLELPDKIKSGQVNGQENAVDVIMASKLYDIQNQVSLWNYSYDGLVFVMNAKSFDKLDKAAQGILRQTSKEVANYQVQLSRGVSISQVDFLKQKGMTVTELKPAEIDVFRNKVAPVYGEYEGVYSKALMDQLKAVTA